MTTTARLSISREITVHDHLGFGFQGDLGLELPASAEHGLDAAGRQRVQGRIRALRAPFVRLHIALADFRTSAAGPNDYSSAAFRDTIGELRLYQATGAEVLLTDWAPHPAWTDNLLANPHPRHHAAIAEAWADMLVHLRKDEGLTCVRWAMLYNEPSHMRVLADGYEGLTRALRRALRDRGLLGDVGVMGPDIVAHRLPGLLESFFEHVTWAQGEVFDAFDAHVYDIATGPALAGHLRPYLERVATLDGYIASGRYPEVFAGLVGRARNEGWTSFGAQGRRPFLLTEFGYGNVHSFVCAENDTFAYGLYLGEVAIHTSQAGVGAALMWTVMDGYMYGTSTYRGQPTHMRWGLWRWADEGWEPRPGFYAWGLVTRHVARHSRVYRVDGNTDRLAASAFEAPAGDWTVLLINREVRPQTVRLTGLPPNRSFVRYTYETASVPTADRGLLSPSAAVDTDAEGTLYCVLSAGSFVSLCSRSDQLFDPLLAVQAAEDRM